MRRLKQTFGSRALEGIALALAGLLFLELHFAMEPPDAGARVSAGITQDLQTPNVSATQSQVTAWRNIILGRPLFDRSRRPPAVQSQITAPAVTIPRLSGIIVTPTIKIAIFSPALGAPIIVNQHSRFGPFTVLAISDAGVTIQGPAGIIVLRSGFSDFVEPEISTARTTVLAGGVYLSLIRIALAATRRWPGLPPVH